MSALEQAKSLFAAHFGGEPDGVWQAPGRVNLIGEHTDYNDGLVLPIALPQRTYAVARQRTDQQFAAVSVGMDPAEPINLDKIAPGQPADWSRYPLGVAWALQAAGLALPGLDVAFASDVPLGAGLSSSAAIEGAIGAALVDLAGADWLADDAGRTRLALACQSAENTIALAPTGGMDQAASIRAQAGHALLLDCADQSIDQVPFALEASGLALLIIDSKVEHSNADGGYGARRADCELACRRLGLDSLRQISPAELPAAMARLGNDRLQRRVRHIVTEIERVRLAAQAMRAGDFVELGHLFVDSHASMRDDYQISCPELDLIVLTALEAGALGARMTGGGFGGSAIALVYQGQLAKTQAAISAAFARVGHHPPAFLVAQAGGPAGRLV
ncbi:MAG: galactokinase [Propionibacteriaceae bacterium]|jgi:galactokinase|nr:galactokinase [Propionibacteriaceae bacterium]